MDYNRGCSPDIETSGCMDIFRLPKCSYHFFRSQRPAAERLTGAGPMVFIANDWTATSATDVRIFSNCDEVALYLNGRLLERKSPDRDRMSTRLAEPPFTFRVGAFEAGLLEAVGYVAGRRVARHAVRTPGAIDHLNLAFDFSGRPRDRVHKDQLFCYASLRDLRGTVVPDAWENIAFGVTGGATLVGTNPIASEAGLASILVQTEPSAPPAAVYAMALLPAAGAPRIVKAALALDGAASPSVARRTAGGAELVVQDRVVASLAADALRFRIPASEAPDRRDPFRRQHPEVALGHR